MKNLRHLNKYFYKYRYKLLLGILFIIISNVFAILPAPIIRSAFDLISESINIFFLLEGFDVNINLFSIFFLFGALVLIMALLKGLFMFFMRQTIIVMSRFVEFDLKNELYEHFQKLPASFFKQNQTGDLMTRVTEDVSRVRMYVGPAVMYTINLTVLFIMVITTMFYINVKLTIFTLLPLPLLSIIIYYVSNIINKRSEVIQKQLSKLTTITQEVLSGIRVIKSYTQEKNTQTRFNEACEDYKDKSIALVKAEALFFPIMILLIGLSTILTIYIGGIQVMRGEITAGNIAEFVIYINMLTWPATALGWIASIAQRAEASQKRINEFLHTQPEIYSENALKKELKGAIEFKDVTFIYPDTQIKALDHVQFKIKEGEKVAIIGRTGSGKSTLANLLLRLYDCTSGEILMDGVNIKDHDEHFLRKQIGYVPQEPFLFSDSVKNNVAFGLEDYDEQKVKHAAADAGLSNDIPQLPQGLDTVVGERGISLSGGQKQRITLARAVIKDPKILVLDDCLSAVDANTEHLIMGNLNRVLTGRTSIIITHRILSLLKLDRILVLENGKIVEEGSHNSLIAREGLYYKIYQQQKLEETEKET